MAHELRKRKNYSSGSRQFTSGDARVYRFIHRLKPSAKLHSELNHCSTYSVKNTRFFTGKVIVTASKRYLSIVVPQVDGGVFPTFVAKRQRI